MRLLCFTLTILLLPLFVRAQDRLPYDTSECARLNRMMSLRIMIQEETILRQQKQINLFSDAVIYNDRSKMDMFGDDNNGRLRRSRNVFAGTTGALLIAIGVLALVLSQK